MERYNYEESVNSVAEVTDEREADSNHRIKPKEKKITKYVSQNPKKNNWYRKEKYVIKENLSE